METLLKQLGIVTSNISIYEQAFIHTSYAYEHNIDYSYETLEFLGDAIVDVIISDYLYRSNKYQEGEMTKIRASYVCENALYEYAYNLGFSQYIKVGVGEEKSNGREKKAIVADVFEAFVAAIYLDLGYEKAKEVTLKIVIPYIEDQSILLFNDYKSELQEAMQIDQKIPNYEVIKESGPSHNKVFQVRVLVDNISYGVGEGQTKKEAEQDAARKALQLLAKN